MTPSYTEILTQTVTTLPIHVSLGLSLISQAASPQPTALLTFTSAPIHLTNAQTVHGGISTLLIDAACYSALIPTLSEGQTAATVASSFQMLDAVPGEGKIYEIEGRVVRRGKSIAFCEGEVRCEGKVIARGSLTKVIKEGRASRL
ncbi:HotDog domain-containing protein [Rhexocercosporidium sp. MPI-PUGE-AT-0058]|nr:HotDog domain-containing protein [Rhexocercosporidium sp. MPI-PUGE-AT-0058]